MNIGSPFLSRMIIMIMQATKPRTTTQAMTMQAIAQPGKDVVSGCVGYRFVRGMSNSIDPNSKPDTRLLTTAMFFLREIGRNTASLCNAVRMDVYAIWRSPSSLIAERARTCSLKSSLVIAPSRTSCQRAWRPGRMEAPTSPNTQGLQRLPVKNTRVD
jgi:hypothetical protein